MKKNTTIIIISATIIVLLIIAAVLINFKSSDREINRSTAAILSTPKVDDTGTSSNI